METINTPTNAPSKPSTLVHPAGKDWYVINQATRELTLQPGMVNAAICLKTGKAQEYPNLVKGPNPRRGMVG